MYARSRLHGTLIGGIVLLLMLGTGTAANAEDSLCARGAPPSAHALLNAKAWSGTADIQVTGPAEMKFSGLPKQSGHIGLTRLHATAHVTFHFGKLVKSGPYSATWAGTAQWSVSEYSHGEAAGNKRVVETSQGNAGDNATTKATFSINFPEETGNGPGNWSIDPGDPSIHYRHTVTDNLGHTETYSGKGAEIAVERLSGNLSGRLPANGYIHGAKVDTRKSRIEAAKVNAEKEKNSQLRSAELTLANMDQQLAHESPNAKLSTPKALIQWTVVPVVRKSGVAIFRGKACIDGRTIHAIVGERIALVAKAVIDGMPIARGRWSVEGRPIRAWKNSRDKAQVIPVPNNAYSKQAITFYWWQPGSYRVSYSVHAYGKRSSAHTIFNIRRPDIKLTATTPAGHYGVFHIKANGVDQALRHGVDYVGNLVYVGKGNFTISFTRSPIPSGFAGETEFVQIEKDAGHIWETNQGPVSCAAEHQNAYVLDTNDPYSTKNGHVIVNPSQAQDSPGRDIYTYIRDIRLVMRLRMYLMYKSARPGSIFVPISYVPWWWKASLHYDKNADYPLSDLAPQRHRKYLKKYLKRIKALVARTEHPIAVRAHAYPVWSAVSKAYLSICNAQQESAMRREEHQ